MKFRFFHGWNNLVYRQRRIQEGRPLPTQRFLWHPHSVFLLFFFKQMTLLQSHVFISCHCTLSIDSTHIQLTLFIVFYLYKGLFLFNWNMPRLSEIFH